MSTSDAATTVVQSLRDLGRVEDVDEALLTAYLALARELDNAETKDRAGLFREFRAYDAAVRSLGGDDDGDGIGDLISRLSTEVGNHTPPRPAN